MFGRQDQFGTNTRKVADKRQDPLDSMCGQGRDFIRSRLDDRQHFLEASAEVEIATWTNDVLPTHRAGRATRMSTEFTLAKGRRWHQPQGPRDVLRIFVGRRFKTKLDTNIGAWRSVSCKSLGRFGVQTCDLKANRRSDGDESTDRDPTKHEAWCCIYKRCGAVEPDGSFISSP